MNIESVHVLNFRSIKNATLRCDELTALVGANGSGKSSFLRAIELFDADKPDVQAQDYHNSNTKNPITVSVTFSGLSDAAKLLFSSYIIDGKLTVDRIFTWDDNRNKTNSEFQGTMLTNPSFLRVRNGSTATEVIDEYANLRKNPEYKHFPILRAKAKIIEQLDKHDQENPIQCQQYADTTSFTPKWKNKEKFVQFVMVPAVHDASADASDAKSSLLTPLTLEIRRRIEANPEYRKLRNDILQTHERAMQSFKSDLADIGIEITQNMRQFVGGAKVDLSWNELEDINLPPTAVVLDEDGHASTVNRAGHGSQRAFVMAVLQTIAQHNQNAQDEQVGSGPFLIMLIEEPELYQHPIRQRHISAMLGSLTKPANGRQMQIIYATHSPHFAGIDKLDNIRLLRKTLATKRKPGATHVHETSPDQVSHRMRSLCKHADSPKSSVTEQLKIIMTPWLNEGFFAKMVVLVEGQSDYAAIMSMSRLKGHNFEGSGISVIPCDGKQKMHYPLIIFTKLKIPIYVVWDCDRCKKPQRKCKSVGKSIPPDASKHKDDTNCYLRTLLKAKPEGNQIEDNFSCFDSDLETTMKREIGEALFKRSISKEKQRLGIQGDCKKALTKSAIMYSVLQQAEKNGTPFKSLENIVAKIVEKSNE